MHTLKDGGTTLLQHHPAALPLQMGAHIKEESFFFPTRSNPIDNAAAAAAAAAAGLIDPHHSHDLHSALVASINSNAAVNGTLATAAVLKNQAQQQQSALVQAQQQVQQQQQQQQSIVVANGSPQQQHQQAAQQAAQQQLQQQAQQTAMVLLNGTGANTNVAVVNNNGSGNNNNNGANNGNVGSSSGRSTPSNSGSVISDPAPGKLFVGGLSWQTSSDKLKEYFNMFGTVTDVLIMKDPITQRSRGFGFITFQEPCSVEKVLQVPIHTLDGKKIDPKHATPKNRPRQANKTKKIFVGGVSQDTSADEVKAYFNQFGAVEETVMLMDQQTKRHRGFGFVTFENEDVVDRVCEIHFHTIKNKKVECKKAQPKEAVTPTAQLLQKRIMLGTMGMAMPTGATQLLTARTANGIATLNPLAVLQSPAQLQMHPGAGSAAANAAAQQAALIGQNPFQVQNAAIAAAAAANPASFGKLLGQYQQNALHSVRYSPYAIPASAAALAAHQQQQHHHHQQQQHHQHAAMAAAAQQSANASHNQAAASAAASNAAQAHSAAGLGVGGAGGGAGASAASHQHQLAAAAAAQQAALVAGNPLGAAGNPYQNYTLTNVDMSSFQGVDWNTMYGMGMYV